MNHVEQRTKYKDCKDARDFWEPNPTEVASDKKHPERTREEAERLLAELLPIARSNLYDNQVVDNALESASMWAIWKAVQTYGDDCVESCAWTALLRDRATTWNNFKHGDDVNPKRDKNNDDGNCVHVTDEYQGMLGKHPDSKAKTSIDNAIDREEESLVNDIRAYATGPSSILSDVQRQTFSLHYCQRMTQSEIAKELGCSESTISKRMDAIHKLLKAEIREKS